MRAVPPPVPAGHPTVSLALRPSARWLRLTGAAGLGVLAAWVPGPYWWAEHTPLILANWLVVVVFAATAALLAEEPCQRGNARLFAGVAVLWAAGHLLLVPHAGPFVTWFCAPLAYPLNGAVLLRYPRSRLQYRAEKAYIAASAGWVIGGRLLWGVVAKPAWLGYPAGSWWPALDPHRGANTVAHSVYFQGSLVLMAVFFVLVVRRLRRARTVDRRTMTPVVVASIALGVIVTINVAISFVPVPNPAMNQIYTPDPAMNHIYTIQAVMMLLVPGAFLVAAVRGRLARAAVADLVLGLTGPATADVVRDGLREVLYDPALDVLYWVAGARGYVDSAGRAGDPGAARGRLVVPVQAADGQPLAVIVADPSLQGHRGLVDAAVSAAAMALENARLQASVRAQVEQLRASRSRIAEAGLSARRRLERDLHDGAQQRLLALKLHLASAQGHVTDSGARAAIGHARAELGQALQELRDLARGIHPAVLAQAGLGAALQGVAERFPLPVQVDAPGSRCSPDAEATAYFLACEALANVVKHAGATRARVHVGQAGGELRVQVTDDGCGGAGLQAGGGLAGMRDRVAALAGTVTVTSPPGGGTSVEARIPCG